MTNNLATEKLRLDLVDLVNSPTDPRTGAGFAAPIASFMLQNGSTGQALLKTGSADTAWQLLVQSLSWLSVKDFGAVGDGVTDDTTAIQNAIDNANSLGGRVVYFPSATYAVTQLSIPGYANIQLWGAGPGSIIKWKWNAAGNPGSMITISGGAARTKLRMLRLDGSGLTNPDAGRGNHLIAITGGASPTIETQLFEMTIGNMVAGSGDGVHVGGTAVGGVSRFWICDSEIESCSRFGIGLDDGFEYGFIRGNYLSGGDTELAMVSAADLGSNGLNILGNQIAHTSGSVRHAVRLEGGATNVTTSVIFSENIILGGFVTTSQVDRFQSGGNIQTSGDYASTDAAWRVFGNVQHALFARTFIDRTSGAGVGPCFSLEKSGGASPKFVRVASPCWVNEKTGANFCTVVDSTQWSIGGALCRSTDAGSSTMYGIDIQAVTANLTDFQVGPGCNLTAAAGSMGAAVRLLCNGANVTDSAVVGNVGDECDYGIRFEVVSGAFTNPPMYAANNFDSSVGNFQNVGVTVRPRIGFNGGTFGANCFEGTGSPEGVVTARTGSFYLRDDGGQATAFYYKETGTGNTGWVAVAAPPIVWGVNDTTTGAGAVFMAPGFISIATATEIKIPVTRPGKVRNLHVQVAGAGTGAGQVTFTVRKNGVDTTLTCGLDNTATGQVSDTTHSFTVATGDLLSISIVKAGGVAAGQTGVVAVLELA